MSSKGRNQFSDFHANAGQRERAAADVAREKAELKASKHPSGFGAPHFPPGENLPPPAKRVAYKKKQKAERARSKSATRSAARTELGEARMNGAIEQLRAGEVAREEYPDATPRAQDARAAAREALGRVESRAEPVLEEAKGHLKRAGEAAVNLVDELVKLFQVPAVLFRVLLDARRQA